MRPKDLFATIRTEGGLLPADLLQRVVSRDRALEGLSPESYHLGVGERLNEAISRSWSRLVNTWAGFQESREKLPERDLGTSLTRERWLLILFQELGYGRLATFKAVEIEGKTYPISHMWQHSPIHLVGFGVDMDRRMAGVAGAARTSPHSLVQEFLNRSDDYLWGFVSNGLKLRILRDNVSLTRQAYIEFDLESMMEGEVFADFALLWLLCHQSRVEAEKPQECWLEKWSKAAQEQGTRALERLRQGVEKAIKTLGVGFLSFPANSSLRDKLRSGDLNKQDYYRQLLRLVYRLIFLFVAEDRGLLFNPAADTMAQERYLAYYSTQRLRRLAERRRGTKHADLYQGLKLVMAKLGHPQGCPELALPALGSFLWSDKAAPDLDKADIANRDLLEAVRNLAFMVDEKVFRSIDYKNLGSEELGSVYESLLELHPEVSTTAATFELQTAGGHERKSTGSYYTPRSLVQALLDSALEPVVEERLKDAWRMANSQWRTEEEKKYAYSIVSGSRSLAAGHESGRAGLPSDQGLSQGRDVRPHEPDTPGSLFDTGQHSRGLGPSGQSGVSAIPADRSGQPEGTGNSPDSQPTNSSLHDRSDSAADKRDNNLEQAIGLTEPQPATPHHLEQLWTQTPLATRHSLLAEQALLSLRLCDPACGSGHFLIAASHRMAKRLAFVRTGDEEPSPEAVQHALRDVIGHCIYGVDINPMAVELCKVGLWMEALEPGKPLSFLEHRIQCGNSLLGTTPALLEKGIPDEAFKPIEGDDKEVCREAKRRNREERQGEYRLPFDQLPPWERLGDLATGLANLDKIDDGDIEGISRKQKQYEELVKSSSYLFGRLWADSWCAAFVWKKVRDSKLPYPITEEVFRRIESNPYSITPEMRAEIERLAQQYQFFHWHLAFPDVFRPMANGEWETANSEWRVANGKDHSPLATYHSPSPSGFALVLGNPPWERIKIQEKEWFASRQPEIANAPNAASRRRMIQELKEEDPAIYADFMEDKRKAEGESHLVRDSGRYPLCGRGDINTYAIFAELKRSIISTTGRVGCIVPSGIATDDTTKFFFQDLMETRILASLYDFENRNIFPQVHSSYKFCLLTMTGPGRPAEEGAEFAFFLHSTEELRDYEKRFTLSAQDIALLNPNTKTCPIFRSQKDAELTKYIYQHVPVLIKENDPEGNPWGITFLRMFDMTNDANLFRARNYLENNGFELQGNIFKKEDTFYYPLFEQNIINQFDHRFASFPQNDPNSTNSNYLSDTEHCNPLMFVLPRFWLNYEDLKDRVMNYPHFGRWLICHRLSIRTTDARSIIVTIMPWNPVGNSLIGMNPDVNAILACCLIASVNSYPFDFVARQKIGGMNLNYFITRQLPVVSIDLLNSECYFDMLKWYEWCKTRILELTYTAWDLEPFAKDCGYDGPPFKWDEERRFLLRCELDAAFFHLYLKGVSEWRESGSKELIEYFPTPRDAVDYIMETFPIVKRKDENKYGDYRTKLTILKMYDQMQEAMETGKPYQTWLDPPPADPRVAHPERKAD